MSVQPARKRKAALVILQDWRSPINARCRCATDSIRQADAIRLREFLASSALEQRTITVQYGVEMRALQSAFEEQRQQPDREHCGAFSQPRLAQASRLEAAQQQGAIRMADASDQQAAASAQLHTMISEQQARAA